MVSAPHFDGCEVLERLRSGPATDWYLGKQRSLGRSVVIKALSPNVLPESPFAGPLIREAKLLARLQHRNIVALYDFVERPRSTWLVLEHVAGPSLDELLEAGKRLSIPAALAISLCLVQTLEYVHARDVVHRDVQPKNILLSLQGAVKLSNFYLAAERSTPPPPELLEADSGFARPAYMSPEQLLSEPTDPRSDLFSVGVILYEMVTGHQPFEASDTRTTTQRIRHEPPPAMSRFVADVPPVVERVVLRALQKLPADRFDDAAEMSLLLGQALAQFSDASPERLVLDALAEAGLIEPRLTPTAPPRKPLETPNILRRAVLVYGASGVALLVGGWLLEHYASPAKRTQAAPAAALELAPDNPAQLSCVVRPWAHVFIDGQQVETTPFAHPIPLRAGVHYLRLDHPNAPSEHRTLDLAAGQFMQLEVEMQLNTPAEELDPAPTPEQGPDAGDRSP